MSQPVVGVKFCGGCKEEYDRIGAWTQLKEMCPEISFTPAVKGMTYDLVLVICGCFSKCPNVSGLIGRNGLLYVCASEQYPDAVKKIRMLANVK